MSKIYTYKSKNVSLKSFAQPIPSENMLPVHLKTMKREYLGEVNLTQPLELPFEVKSGDLWR